MTQKLSHVSWVEIHIIKRKNSKNYIFIILFVVSMVFFYMSALISTDSYSFAVRNTTDCQPGIVSSVRCRIRNSASKLIALQSPWSVSDANATDTKDAGVKVGDLDWYRGQLDKKPELLFPERKDTKMTIGLVTHHFNRPSDHFIWEKFIEDLKSCPEMKDKCEFTHDVARIPTLDVVAIYVRDNFKMVEPVNRPAYQKWVFSIIESPVHTYNNLKAIRYHFNTTMTYRMNSDIPYFYGICEKIIPEKVKPLPELPSNHTYLAAKKYLAAWFVHNCNAPSLRQTFIAGLKKHIDIHVYGTCGKYKCNYDNGEFCDKTLLNRDYKFYMSLENSFCKEYITEKTFRILDLNVIPVISSYTDLKNRLPPHSYIDTRDFSSYEELAAYMIKVGSDEKLYAEYFAWKRQGWKCYKHENYSESIGCRMCRHCWKNRHKHEVADVLNHWDRGQNCISGNTFYAKYFAPRSTTMPPTKTTMSSANSTEVVTKS